MNETISNDGLEAEQRRPNLVVATSTFYKTWYPGDLISPRDSDKIRGDVALESLGKAVGQGYQVIDIDGGSSPEFQAELASRGVQVSPQLERGLSASRREGNTLAANLNPRAIFTTEPEKPVLMDSISLLLQPILDGSADIVFAQRDPKSFDTYPPVQARFEQRSNKVANDLLRKHGLLKEGDPNLDWWMGARMFKNSPEVLKLFQTKYDLRPFGSSIDGVINLDTWPNALYLPVVSALAQGMRVVGVPVHYEHSKQMTESEIGNPEFDRKREVQFKGIIIAMMEMVRKLELESGKSTKPTRII